MAERDGQNPDTGRHEMEANRLFELVNHLSLKVRGERDIVVVFTAVNGLFKVSGIQNGVELFGVTSRLSRAEAYAQVDPKLRKRITDRLAEIDQELANRRKRR